MPGCIGSAFHILLHWSSCSSSRCTNAGMLCVTAAHLVEWNVNELVKLCRKVGNSLNSKWCAIVYWECISHPTSLKLVCLPSHCTSAGMLQHRVGAASLQTGLFTSIHFFHSPLIIDISVSFWLLMVHGTEIRHVVKGALGLLFYRAFTVKSAQWNKNRVEGQTLSKSASKLSPTILMHIHLW